MATNTKPIPKPATLDDAESDLVAAINRRLAKMSPKQRAEADKKTLEIAARVRARRGKR